MNTCEMHWKWFCLLSCLLAACVGERKADPSWAPHSVCVTICASWQHELGEIFSSFVYLGQWRVAEIVKRLLVLGGGALHEEKEQCRTKAVCELWLWLSRGQSLCCWGCTRHHALMGCDASNGQSHGAVLPAPSGAASLGLHCQALCKGRLPQQSLGSLQPPTPREMGCVIWGFSFSYQGTFLLPSSFL